MHRAKYNMMRRAKIVTTNPIKISVSYFSSAFLEFMLSKLSTKVAKTTIEEEARWTLASKILLVKSPGGSAAAPLNIAKNLTSYGKDW